MSKNIKVTDHALLRYLERVLGYDIAHMKNQMLPEEVKSAIRAGALSVEHLGVTYVIENHKVVTIQTTNRRYGKGSL